MDRSGKHRESPKSTRPDRTRVPAAIEREAPVSERGAEARASGEAEEREIEDRLRYLGYID